MLELLKKKCELTQTEDIQNKSTIEALRSQLLDKCSELDALKAQNKQLVKDSETFEWYEQKHITCDYH